MKSLFSYLSIAEFDDVFFVVLFAEFDVVLFV
jgi:hypothetical protein